MILTKTPLRISLFGGGTDMPEFYTHHPGAVLSFAINKYIYVGVNDKFDGQTRVSYSKTEIVDEPWKLEHDLVRETLADFKLKGLEITSVSDIPGEGSGLGSSSAFTVGLVVALTRYMDGDLNVHPSFFANLAYEIERDLCGHPVGKQDHYAAAHGGLHYFQFNSDDTVSAELIRMTPALKYFLENHIMLFWTGTTRSANNILKQQANGFSEKGNRIEFGKELVEYAREARNLLEDETFENIGPMLDGAWQYKKRLARVSDEKIDALYRHAIDAGATGGKICGAGGGGFLMMVADPKDQRAVEKAVGLRRVCFRVEERGSHVVYNDK